MALILIRSALFNAAMFSWTIALYLLYVPTLLLPPRVLVACLHFWIGGLFAMQSGIIGLRFAFRGVENLPKPPFIVASAHQSAWETIVFYKLFRQPAYIVKQELTYVPGFSRFARKAGLIALDRSGRTVSARRMLREAGEVLAAGRQVVIFPEGTRSPPGKPVEIRPGVSAMYRHCRAPVIPVSLNSGLYWGRRSFLKRPGTVLVEFGEPIEPGLPADEFSILLAARIDAGNRRLLAEADEAASKQGR